MYICIYVCIYTYIFYVYVRIYIYIPKILEIRGENSHHERSDCVTGGVGNLMDSPQAKQTSN